MKIAFAGTPEFARAALEALHAVGHEITLVMTQPDRPAGRGMQLQASPVKQFAVAHGLPVLQARSLRPDGKFGAEALQAHAVLRATPIDVMVVAAYGLILPQTVLDIPPRGCLNIHASLLPRWRGAAPIQRAIEAGDCATGITIMQMDAGLDTGAMLLRDELAITPDDTSASLHDKLTALGARLIVEALEGLERGELKATPQHAEGVTYAAKITRADAALDFTRPAQELARRVRAFDSEARIGSTTLKIFAASPLPQAGDALPGEIVALDRQGIVVATGAGALQLGILQKPGGKRLAAAQFLAGFPMQVGDRFELPATDA